MSTKVTVIFLTYLWHQLSNLVLLDWARGITSRILKRIGVGEVANRMMRHIIVTPL